MNLVLCAGPETGSASFVNIVLHKDPGYGTISSGAGRQPRVEMSSRQCLGPTVTAALQQRLFDCNRDREAMEAAG